MDDKLPLLMIFLFSSADTEKKKYKQQHTTKEEKNESLKDFWPMLRSTGEDDPPDKEGVKQAH